MRKDDRAKRQMEKLEADLDRLYDAGKYFSKALAREKGLSVAQHDRIVARMRVPFKSMRKRVEKILAQGLQRRLNSLDKIINPLSGVRYEVEMEREKVLYGENT